MSTHTQIPTPLLLLLLLLLLIITKEVFPVVRNDV